MTTPSLEIRNAKKFHRDEWMRKVHTLNDISFALAEGSCLGLLGHNGAGKTTTIRMILGLLRQTSGEVLFQGKPMTRADRNVIGYMPEINKLPAELRCKEVLYHHLLMYRADIGFVEAKKRTMARLQEVGLGGSENKKISELSKGMARRLGWALATLHEPKLLILDEPFSGLDPYARIFLEERVALMKNKGLSILLCTHELEAAKRLCDQVVVLNKGQVVFDSAKTAQAWDERTLIRFFYPAEITESAHGKEPTEQQSQPVHRAS